LYDRTVEDVAAWKVPEPWVPVTLLGDAFHPVASYAMAGGGSNAMADGVAVAKEILCAALVQNQQLVDSNQNALFAKALRQYEGPVRKRSIPQAKSSNLNTVILHSGWIGERTAYIVAWVINFVLQILGKK
jgi:2-polyprenyl-6-methoxyphenol hydroxylase-like FAD-dependent oxidoreductase